MEKVILSKIHPYYKDRVYLYVVGCFEDEVYFSIRDKITHNTIYVGSFNKVKRS